jgi:DNA helicase HerA-like ATPase
LSSLGEIERFPKSPAERKAITWVRIERLPIHPTNVKDYDLLSRWQGVLSTLHAWGHRVIYLLLRNGGRTHLYIGAVPLTGMISAESASAQLSQAAKSQMPGIELTPVDPQEMFGRCIIPLAAMEAVGAVTGLPSLRTSGQNTLLQTLDQVAFGIRDFYQEEHDYAFVAIADPVSDQEIVGATQALRELGSVIHSEVSWEANQSHTDQKGESKSGLLGVGMALRSAAAATAFVPPAKPFLYMLGCVVGGKSSSTSKSDSQCTSRRYLDKTAEYCESVIDRHIERYKRGRNLGFWNVGLYVLARTETTVSTVIGILRSIYSGDASYLEPIRVHTLRRGSGAAECIQGMQLVPLPVERESKRQLQKAYNTSGWWHPLGRMFESLATPLNTEELSIATSLPRRDVPGLRFVRNAVRFATNPPKLEPDKHCITIGNVMDTGVELEMPYAFDINSLVKHALVTGVTGSGKSTTCRRLIQEVIPRRIPTLIIEPTKEEYVRWAIARNKQCPSEEQIEVFVPGWEAFEGVPLQQLRLSPFEPAAVEGALVDYAARYERLSAILRVSLPMSDILPTLLEEAIFILMQRKIDTRFIDQELNPSALYPKLEELVQVSQSLVESRSYEKRIQDNLIAAIKTRILALTRGRRGQILNVEKSTPFELLFEKSVVINLSQIPDDRDKALIMSLLLLALGEYRLSKYRNDPHYRDSADNNKLCHLAVIEEAHRLVKNPERDISGMGNPQAIVSEMFSDMLSEFRAYGQGMMIVDQVPSRLIPNAIKNTNCKIVHRLVASDDRLAMASSMALRPDQQDIIAVLPVGTAIVCGDLDDAASWVRIK